MKKVLNYVLATIILTSLTACVIVPPHAEYVGPRVSVFAPYPVYGQPYYGEPMHHHDSHREWDRRW